MKQKTENKLWQDHTIGYFFAESWIVLHNILQIQNNNNKEIIKWLYFPTDFMIFMLLLRQETVYYLLEADKTIFP